MQVVVNDVIHDESLIEQGNEYCGNFYMHLLLAAGYPEEALPVADFIRQYHDLSPGYWLVASPIYWEATHNDAMIRSAGPELAIDEAGQDWFAAFSEFVTPEGMTPFYVDETTWLLRCDAKPAISSKPVHQILHQSIMPELKMLDESLYWQRFITESQMFFSAHPLNQARQLPINGLWLWGSGVLNTPGALPVICQTEAMERLASLITINTSSYQQNKKLPKKSLLIFEHLNHDDLTRLKKQLKNKNVKWFWNNALYRHQPQSWFSRLWS